MTHPYWDKNFFEVLLMFFRRMLELIFGKLTLVQLVSDELQLLILIMVGVSAATLGCYIVSRKMSMLANSLSHTVLLGIVMSYILVTVFAMKRGEALLTMNFKVLVMASCITALLTTFLSDALHRFCKLQEDASIGLVFTTFFALGVTLLTLFSRDAHIGTEAIMGNIDTVVFRDVVTLFSIMVMNVLIVFLFFKELKLTTFDSTFARSMGFSSQAMNYLLMLLTSITSVFAFKAIGVFLFLGFLVAPVMAAKILARSLKQMMILAVSFSILASFISVALARHLLSYYGVAISSSALTTVCLALFVPLALAFKHLKSTGRYPLTSSPS